MFKKIFNRYIRYKTKNLKAIPLFVMTFDWKKFQKDGKKDSYLLYVLHSDIANDLILRRKLSECVDYIRDNYDIEIFTKI
nr:MAG TPA: YqzL-like protein [Caudoviricetes sp.]